jgi:regulator of nonsense transcripts 2
MRTQQEAERAEQQKIKNLVLNYDLTDDQHDGEESSFHYQYLPGTNCTRVVGKGSLNKSFKPWNENGRFQQETTTTDCKEMDFDPPPHTPGATDSTQTKAFTDQTGSIENAHGPPRLDKSGNSRSKQRARKLQLTDMDWYGKRSSNLPAEPPPAQASLDDSVVDKNKREMSRRDSARGGGRRAYRTAG